MDSDYEDGRYHCFNLKHLHLRQRFLGNFLSVNTELLKSTTAISHEEIGRISIPDEEVNYANDGGGRSQVINLDDFPYYDDHEPDGNRHALDSGGHHKQSTGQLCCLAIRAENYDESADLTEN